MRLQASKMSAGRNGAPVLAALLVCTLLLTVVRADPIPAPDLDKCEATYLFPRNVPGYCCPPKLGMEPKEWDGGDQPCGNVRLRRPCHRLEDWERDRYNRAFEMMRELDWQEPKSLYQLNNMHCSHCMHALPLPWPDAHVQVHFSWLFLSWHRWYLYFLERNIGSLLDDDSFALCYWNWDNMIEEGAAQIPWLFIKEPALYDEHRSPRHQPPSIANLTFVLAINQPIPPKQNVPQPNPPELIESNLAIMHQAIVEVATREGFFGASFRRGHPTPAFFSPSQGTLEATVHNSIHQWTGNETEIDAVDMGSFWSAANDPIFYSHHTNIDRLWDVWKSLGDWRSDIDDPDYLNSEFTFYDQKDEYVKVRIADSLESKRLCYDYQDIPEADQKWINYQSSSCSNLDSQQKKQEWLQTIPEYQPGSHPLVVTAATSPLTIRIKRPSPQHKPRSSTGNESSEFVQVLVLGNVSIDWTNSASAMVFVQLPMAPADAPRPAVTCTEFLGMVSSIPHAMAAGVSASYHWGLDKKLEQLQATSLEDVAVTILAGEQHTSHHPISIGSVGIHYKRR